MLAATGQAQLPRVNPLLKGQILPPTVFTSATGAAANIYDNTINPPLQELWLQNSSNQAVKVALNTDAGAAVFHWVLKAATGADTGDGGELRIPISLGIKSVSIYAAAAYRVLFIAVINSQYQGRI